MKREWLVKKQQTGGVDVPVVVSGTIIATSLSLVRKIVRGVLNMKLTCSASLTVPSPQPHRSHLRRARQHLQAQVPQVQHLPVQHL
jgi:hypothetical protein